MKKILFLMLVTFLVSMLTSNAQEEEKVHLKIIKEKDGKIIEEIDTFYISQGEGILYIDGEGKHKHSIDSILGNYKVCTHKEKKFIAISDEGQPCDSIINMFWNIHEGHDADSLSLEKWHFYRDGSHSTIKTDKGSVWVMADSLELIYDIHVDDKDGIIVIKSEEGKQVEVLKKNFDKSMVWTIDSVGKGSTDMEKVFIYKTGTNTIDILKEEDAHHKIVKEVIINKNGEAEKNIEIIIGNVKNGEKTIEMFFDEDDTLDSTKFIELEEALAHVGEDVKIIKYKTGDDKIVIKAEITSETSKDEEIKTKKMKLKHGSVKGLFKIDLKLEDKVSTLIIVENSDGKTVFSDKLKKFDGSYSGTINITKEPDGKYILQVIQEGKTIIKKELIK